MILMRIDTFITRPPHSILIYFSEFYLQVLLNLLYIDNVYVHNYTIKAFLKMFLTCMSCLMSLSKGLLSDILKYLPF